MTGSPEVSLLARTGKRVVREEDGREWQSPSRKWRAGKGKKKVSKKKTNGSLENYKREILLKLGKKV